MMIVAAVQHLCRQAARTAGLCADTFLTSMSPLTYERGDWLAADALADKEAEEEVAEPKRDLESKLQAAKARIQLARIAPDAVEPPLEDWERELLGLEATAEFPKASPVVEEENDVLEPPDPLHAPPVCSEGPDGVVTHSPASTVGVPTSLPRFKASDLIDIAEQYIDDICRNAIPLGSTKWSRYVAEVVVSAITFELQGLAFDQSNQTPQ